MSELREILKGLQSEAYEQAILAWALKAVGEDYSFTNDAFPTEFEKRLLEDRNKMLAIIRMRLQA